MNYIFNQNICRLQQIISGVCQFTQNKRQETFCSGRQTATFSGHTGFHHFFKQMADSIVFGTVSQLTDRNAFRSHLMGDDFRSSMGIIIRDIKMNIHIAHSRRAAFFTVMVFARFQYQNIVFLYMITDLFFINIPTALRKV